MEQEAHLAFSMREAPHTHCHTFSPERLQPPQAHMENSIQQHPDSPSARVLLGDWMRLTSLCSHSSRRRRMFWSSERYVLATVSSLSSANWDKPKEQLSSEPPTQATWC